MQWPPLTTRTSCPSWAQPARCIGCSSVRSPAFSLVADRAGCWLPLIAVRACRCALHARPCAAPTPTGFLAARIMPQHMPSSDSVCIIPSTAYAGARPLLAGDRLYGRRQPGALAARQRAHAAAHQAAAAAQRARADGARRALLARRPLCCGQCCVLCCVVHFAPFECEFRWDAY